MKTAKIYSDSEFVATAWQTRITDSSILPGFLAQNVRFKHSSMLTGGNPGAYSRLEITGEHDENNSFSTEEDIKVSINHLNLCTNYDLRKHGKIQSIDFYCDLNIFPSEENNESQVSTSYALLIMQDGILYQTRPDIMIKPLNKGKWVGYTINNIKSEHFICAMPVSDKTKDDTKFFPLHPNFSRAGGNVQFGYVVHVTCKGEKLHSISGIDNWKVSIAFEGESGTMTADVEDLKRRLSIETQERQRMERLLLNEKLRSDRELREFKLTAERESRNSRSSAVGSPNIALGEYRSNMRDSDNGNNICYSGIVKAAQKKWNLKEKECVVEKRALEESRQTVVKLEEKLAVVQERLNEKEKQLSECNEQLDQERNMKEQVEKMWYSQSENQTSELKQMEQMMIKNQSEVGYLNNLLNQSRAEVEQLTESMTRQSDNLDRYQSEKMNLIDLNEELRTQLKNMAEELAHAQKVELDLQASIKGISEEKYSLIEQISALEEELNQVKEEMKCQSENLRIYQIGKEEIGRALESSASEMNQLGAELQQVLEQKNQLQNEVMLEKAFKEQLESELQQERAEKKVMEDANSRMLLGLLDDLKKQKEEIEAMKQKIEEETDLRQKAEIALRQLEDIFEVTGEDEDESVKSF